jgi:hypothetical protein
MQAGLKRRQVDRKSTSLSESGSEDGSIYQESSRYNQKRHRSAGIATFTGKSTGGKPSKTPSQCLGEPDDDVRIGEPVDFDSEELGILNAALVSSGTQGLNPTLNQSLDTESTDLTPSFSIYAEQSHETQLGGLFLTETQVGSGTLDTDYLPEFGSGAFHSGNGRAKPCHSNGLELILGKATHSRNSMASGAGEGGLLQRSDHKNDMRDSTIFSIPTPLLTFHRAWPILHSTTLWGQSSTILSDALAPFSLPLQPLSSHHLFSPGAYGELINIFIPKSVCSACHL